MKEIKFKAWDKRDKIMSAPMNLSEILNANPHFHTKMRERQIWLQYTGLKDKNGKEIYEGYIVTYPQATYGGFRWDEMLVSTVEWDEVHSGYEIAQAMNEDPMSFIQPENVVEVIGNIYENPELLK